MSAFGCLTAFDRDDDHWVAVLCFAGDHTTEAMAIAAIPAIHAQVTATEDAKEVIRSFVESREAKLQGR